jgi:hypothetical protein
VVELNQPISTLQNCAVLEQTSWVAQVCIKALNDYRGTSCLLEITFNKEETILNPQAAKRSRALLLFQVKDSGKPWASLRMKTEEHGPRHPSAAFIAHQPRSRLLLCTAPRQTSRILNTGSSCKHTGYLQHSILHSGPCSVGGRKFRIAYNRIASNTV